MAKKSDPSRRALSAARRKLEFNVVAYEVKHNKVAFMERLIRNLEFRRDAAGALCQVYTARSRCGHAGCYPIITFSGKKFGESSNIAITAARVFLILKLCRPIRVGFDAGHTCMTRTCVSHVEEQSREENYRERDTRLAARKARGQAGEDAPF